MTDNTASLATKHSLYSQTRDSIKTGDLLAWRITKVSNIFGFILILYQKLFKVKFSHVAVAVWIGNRLFAVEATPSKVRIIPMSMLDNFYLISAGVQDNVSHFDIIGTHIGKPYSLFDLVRVIFGFKGSESSLYCSELALQYYDEIGYFTDDVDEFGDHIPTPDDIVERVLAQSKSPIEFVRIDKGNLNDRL